MTREASWLTLRAQQLLHELGLGYAWITLMPSWQVGCLMALLTFAEPASGAIGLLASVCAWFAAHAAGADSTERPVAIFNGLLSGLLVSFLWQPSAGTLALAVMAGVFAGWLAVVLGRLIWVQLQLPVLSVPFALVGMVTMAAGESLSALQRKPFAVPVTYFSRELDAFFSALSNLYFISDTRIGFVMALLLLAFSRYYLLLAGLGYVTAWSWLHMLGASPEHLASTAWDTNAVLAALLVGGLFASPSFATAGLALLAAVFAAWLSLALGRVLHVAQLLPFSVPFVLASWLVLYAAVRNSRLTGSFNLLHPDSPERSYIRNRIGRARLGSVGSTPLALPYMGVWTVSQGFAGAYTHRGPWRHALDFIEVKAGKSFTNRGNRLEDFFCYNLPVLAPAAGQVWRVVNDVPDNPPGQINMAANWGNYVVIRMTNGLFALVAHLRPGSVTVSPGQWIQPGDLLGRCGNSGRSPQPHIHLHVQVGDAPGSPTSPFHLAGVLCGRDKREPEFQLAVVPREGDRVVAAAPGDVRPLYLMAGRGLRYAVASSERLPSDWTIHCEVDTLGRMVLVSSRGARCVAEATWAVFSCYERNSVVDPIFDIWLLSCGYTPASMQVSSWHDARIPASWIPHIGARVLAALCWPWMVFARAAYTRVWDAQSQGWRQTAQLRQILSGISLQADTLLAPQIGCTRINAQQGAKHYALQAISTFQLADLGVPGWETPLRPVTRPA